MGVPFRESEAECRPTSTKVTGIPQSNKACTGTPKEVHTPELEIRVFRLSLTTKSQNG